MKVIRVKTNKGIEYHIPLEEVAKNRANYYSEKDGVEIGGDDWKAEVQFVMDDDYEGIDWLQNNTNFSYFEKAAIKIEVPLSDEEENYDCDFDTLIENINH